MFEARSKVESRILSRSLSMAISCSRAAFSLSSVASCFVRQLAANGPSSLVNLLRAARARAQAANLGRRGGRRAPRSNWLDAA